MDDPTPAPSRLSNWMARHMAPHALAWVLLAGMGGVLADSLKAANWVPASAPLLLAVWCGLAFGVWLAHSRFHGWAAAAYHLALGVLVLSLAIGRILPPPGQIAHSSFWVTLDLAHIRLLSYADRLAGWAATLAAGNVVQDNGLFLLSIGLLAWGAGAWLAWAVERRQRALQGLLPYGLLLGINAYLSNQAVTGLWLFLGFAVLLAARTAFVELHHSWQRRGVDYPDGLSWDWTAAVASLGLVILLAARLAPIVGTPEGWRNLGDLLREAQKTLNTTTTHLFGKVNPPPPHPEDYSTGAEPVAPAAVTPEMSYIGAAPPQSNAVVMWVETSDPPPPAPASEDPLDLSPNGPVHSWRSSIFGLYTGQGWQALPVQSQPPPGTGPLPAADASTVAGRYLLTQTFDILASHGQNLFGANLPVKVEGAGLGYVGPGGSPVIEGNASQYRVQSWATRVTDVQLRAAPTTYPAEIANIYLQLPAGLPARVRDLARRVAGNAATPFDKAVRIQDYLRLSYAYDLQVPPAPAGQDVVDYFLFDAPGGFCSYYASAMAVMLRSQGVPARVVSGYANGTYDFTRQAYRVTPSDAHAWVEVYFPGYGWIEFEPTANRPRPNYETPAGQSAASREPLPPRPVPPLPAWLGTAFTAAAIAVPLGLLGLAFWLQAKRRRQAAARTPAQQAVFNYRALRRLLNWAGLSAPPSATPAEYLQAYRAALAGRGALLAALEQATGLYQRAVYSPHSPSQAEMAQVRGLSEQSWRAWAGLVWRRFWRRALLRLNQSPGHTDRP